MNQLTQESKSLWRIKNEYVKDAKNSKEIKALWTKMAQDKVVHITELEKVIAVEIKKGK